jgi:hypothetical protein
MSGSGWAVPPLVSLLFCLTTEAISAQCSEFRLSPSVLTVWLLNKTWDFLNHRAGSRAACASQALVRKGKVVTWKPGVYQRELLFRASWARAPSVGATGEKWGGTKKKPFIQSFSESWRKLWDLIRRSEHVQGPADFFFFMPILKLVCHNLAGYLQTSLLRQIKHSESCCLASLSMQGFQEEISHICISL